MNELLNQIEKGLDANLYFLSLFVSLSIPDICGALNSQDGESSREKYEDWFDKYVALKYGGILGGKDCYYFRCSLLHQGTSLHPDSSYNRVLFIEPGTSTCIFHMCKTNDALTIDINKFCMEIIDGANEYLTQNENTELYKRNYDKFMRRYPTGLAPYVVGCPVIG